MKLKLVLLSLIVIFFASSCDFFNLMNNNLELKTGTLSLAITEDNRFGTMLPDLPAPDTYKINFLSGPVETDSRVLSFNELPLELELALGSWTIQVEALKENRAFASDSRVIEISQGSNNIDFILQPSVSGEGSLSLTIRWPQSQNVSSILGQLTHQSSGEIFPVKFTQENSTLAKANPVLKGGDYYLLLTLKNSEGKIIALDDGIIRIYSELTTSSDIIFEEKNFNGRPLPVVNLAANLSKNTIELNWNDMAWNESAIIVERKNDAIHDNFSELLTLPPDTSSYTDTDVLGNTQYSYRIKTRNSQGDSDYCTEVAIRTLNNDAFITNFVIIDSNNSSVNIEFTDYAAVKKMDLADLSSISPSISISDHASISPASGSSLDFSQGPVNFIVTAETGATNEYSLTLLGNVIFVTQTGSGNYSGASWSHAMDNIQTALDAAGSGDQIWIASGTYFPVSWPTSGITEEIQTRHFTLKDEVRIFGGFSGNEKTLSERDLENNITLISGDLNQDDHESLFSENSLHLFYFSGDGNESLHIDGISFSGGYNRFLYDSERDLEGACLYVDNFDSLTIKDCIFIQNQGNPVYLKNAGSLVVSSNQFLNNESPATNPILYLQEKNEGSYSEPQNCLISGNRFSNNIIASHSIIAVPFNHNWHIRFIQNIIDNNQCAGDFGTGLYIAYDNSGNDVKTLIKANLFIDNSVNPDANSALSSAAINLDASSSENLVELISFNNIIYNNNQLFLELNETYPAGPGGGYRLNNINTAILAHETLVNNLGSTTGALYLEGETELIVYNSVFYKNYGETYPQQAILDNSSALFYNSLLQENLPAFELESFGPGYAMGIDCSLSSSADFSDWENFPGTDGVWLTDDDGLAISSSSVYINSGKTNILNESDFGIDIKGDGDTSDSLTDYADICSLPRVVGYAPEPGAYEDQTNNTNLQETTRYYVDIDATGNASALNWTNAVNSLDEVLMFAAASASSENPIEIWVAEGTYSPQRWPEGGSDPRERHYFLPSYVSLYGGFSGNETLLSERDVNTYQTILTADINGNDIDTDNDNFKDNNRDENLYHIFMNNGNNYPTPINSRLDGFILTGGQADYSSEGSEYNNCGGAILVCDSDNLWIENCLFDNNFADFFGGAIVSDQPNQNTSYLNDNQFTHNFAGEGGAIFQAGGDLEINLNSFDSNMSYDSGGAVYFTGYSDGEASETISIRDSEFNSNMSLGEGGALFFTESFFVIEDSLFDSNQAAYCGGAIEFDSLSYPDTSTNNHNYILNSEFLNNSVIVDRNIDSFMGGGAIWTSSAIRIAECWFDSNVTDAMGGAIYYATDTGDYLTSFNNIFTRNQALNGGVAYTDAGALYFQNFVFYLNSAEGYGSGIYGSCDIDDIYLINGTISSQLGTSYIIFTPSEMAPKSANIIAFEDNSGNLHSNPYNETECYEDVPVSLCPYYSDLGAETDYIQLSSTNSPLKTENAPISMGISESDLMGVDYNLDGEINSDPLLLGDITGYLGDEIVVGAYYTIPVEGGDREDPVDGGELH